MNALTSFQCAVLRAIQDPLPLCDRPFELLAATLGTTEGLLLDEICRLKSDGLIRRFRSQIRYRALGRTAVLAAAAVPEERLEQTAAVVSDLATVSHNYQRDARLNLWFTLQGASMADIDAVLKRLGQSTDLPFYSFPAVRVYKLDVRFDPAGPGADWFEPGPLKTSSVAIEPACLTPDEKRAIEIIQREIPLVCRPFDALLNTTGEGAAVALLQSLADKGVLSKIAAVVHYARLGYTANAMLAAVVDADHIDAVGGTLARIPAVTHCYYRRPCPDWPYTLYAMIHADRMDRITSFTHRFCEASGIDDCQLLPSVREFKKKPVTVSLP